jgi:eukaryotic-like serine/threonine-protein kinase
MARVEHRDLSGQVLDGRYRVLGPIGQGAMGSVYRAEHLKLGRVVAVKVMNEQVPNEMSSRRRFDREAAAMAKLEHPHCASVLDVGVHGDQPFVVMEFVSGQSLDALVAEGPLPIPRAVEITRQVLFGLAHAHEHGIIHRDIKPSNIVLSQKAGVGDHVKILDFGLAKLSQETSNLTIGFIVGTPSYMAPEQIRGLALDQRVDVYACGVLLFELLTGTKPFRAPSGDPLAVCMAHLNDAAPRLADALPGRDFGALEQVVTHALAKDRDRRFSSAGAFANALVAAVPGRPSAPQMAVPGPGPGRPPASQEAATAALAPATSPPPTGATVALADADLVQVHSGGVMSGAALASPTGATVSLATAELETERSQTRPEAPASPTGATVSLAAAALETERSQTRPEAPPAPPRLASEPGVPPPPASVRLASEPGVPPAPARLASEPGVPAPVRLASEPGVPAPVRPQAVPRSRRGLAIGGVAVALAGVIAVVAVFAGGGGTPSGSPSPPAAGSAAGSAASPPASEPPAAASVEPAPESPPVPEPAPTPAPVSASDDPVAAIIAQAGELAAARRRDAAINLLVKARRTHPRDARLPYHAGLLYIDKMFRTDGLKQLRAAIALDPRYRTDPPLIEAVVRAFNTTAQYDWALANFLRKDIGGPAIPVLQDVAKNHKNPIVRSRAAAELRRY